MRIFRSNDSLNIADVSALGDSVRLEELALAGPIWVSHLEADNGGSYAWNAARNI